MNRRQPRLLTRTALALLALLLSATTAAAQLPEPDDSDPVEENTRVFRRSLYILKFTPLKSFDELDSTSILIVLGDTRRLNEVPGGLARFLQNGGAALIASDKPMERGARAALVRA